MLGGVFIRLLFLLAFALLLCQCGKKKPAWQPESPKITTGPIQGEMIALRQWVATGVDKTGQLTAQQGTSTEVLIHTEEASTGESVTERWSQEAIQILTAMLDDPDSAPAIEVTALTQTKSRHPHSIRHGGNQNRGWAPSLLRSTDQDSEPLSDSLHSLQRRFNEPPDVHLKPISVESGSDLKTRILVTHTGSTRTSDGQLLLLEIHATWLCEWQMDTPLKLTGITLESYKESLVHKAPLFSDVTASVIPDYQSPQIQGGIEHWSQHITRYGDLFQTGHHGLAVGDVNGDGRDDLYVCDGGSLPNRLYVQQPDGTTRERAHEANVDLLEDSRGALLIDLDNDGDQDLVVCTIAMLAIFENDSTGKFTLRGGHPGAPFAGSISASDPDSDGDLDIYLCVYEGNERDRTQRGFQSSSPYPFHDATNGGRNILLENIGNFSFVDATERFGLDLNNSRWSFAASWDDLDRDGDPDLYVANDFGRNNLYRNDNGHFTDIAAEAAVEDMAAGMSVAWGDFNRDAKPDLYVGNMFSSAGRRISQQEDFVQGRSAATLLGTQRMARGNSLFAGGDNTFQDVSETAGVTMGRWAWSSAFADIDNDGWEDLLIANGYLTNRRDDDL